MTFKQGKLRGLFPICSNCYDFFLASPKINTIINFSSSDEKERFSMRILQRIGIQVDEYSVLNVHRIGIEIPPRYVFEELLQWDGSSSFWPNQVAHVNRIDESLENIVIYTFGIQKILIPFLRKKEIRIRPLFNMSAVKIQSLPSPWEVDNARYLLYKCSGGYPIGIFCIYVRSSIAEEGEKEKAQLFSLVAFDFYGRKSWFSKYILNPVWQRIHNRVSGNILNYMKSTFESKFSEHTNN